MDSSGIFVELYGTGALSSATAARGVPTLRRFQPEDLRYFCGWQAVERLLELAVTSPAEVTQWTPGEYPMVATLEGTRRRVACTVHMPPSSLLRAQDRNPRSLVRSPEQP